MYLEHQPIIASYARKSPDHLARVMQFVILTVQVKLAQVPANMETAEQGGTDASGVLYGFKLKAYAQAWINREIHYSFGEHVMLHSHCDHETTCTMIEYFAGLWGYGPVKAGFICQLVYGLGGCLDTHNLKRFNIYPRAFDSYCQLRSTKGRRAMVERYVATTEALGGPSGLWDSWCTHVAKIQPSLYRNADHVSRLHCEALGL